MTGKKATKKKAATDPDVKALIMDPRIKLETISFASRSSRETQEIEGNAKDKAAPQAKVNAWLKFQFKQPFMQTDRIRRFNVLRLW